MEAKTMEIKNDLQRIENRQLQNFGLLWDLKYGGFEPQKEDQLKTASKMLATSIMKKIELANYKPKILRKDFDQCDVAPDLNCDKNFITSMQKATKSIQGLSVTRRVINGISFNVFTDNNGVEYVKGTDYEREIQIRDRTITCIKTQDILTVSDVEFMLRANGKN